jgi:hypothetical protein
MNWIKVWALIRTVLTLGFMRTSSSPSPTPLDDSPVGFGPWPTVPNLPPVRTWQQWLERLPILLWNLEEATAALGSCEFWNEGRIAEPVRGHLSAQANFLRDVRIGVNLLRQALQDAAEDWNLQRVHRLVLAWNRINGAGQCLAGYEALGLEFIDDDNKGCVGEGYCWRLYRLGEALGEVIFNEDRSPWCRLLAQEMSPRSAPRVSISHIDDSGTPRSIPVTERTFLSMLGQTRSVYCD